MKLILFLICLFLYTFCGQITARLFNRFDPSSNYYGHAKIDHDIYIFFGSSLWPVSLMIWLFNKQPYLIVIHFENMLERRKDKLPTTAKTAYRD